MTKIKVGDMIKFKDFKYLKANYSDRPHWRMFEIANNIATIVSIRDDGTYIVKMRENTDRVPNMNDFPVTEDMFYKLSEKELRFIKAFTLDKQN